VILREEEELVGRFMTQKGIVENLTKE
jgi:hypothetical protein